MMHNLEQVRAHASTCLTERWPGDPYPAAAVEERVARAALANAWQAVADEAQATANAALSVPIQYPAHPGRDLRRLVEAAEALTPQVEKATRAARLAEHQLPPRRVPKGTP